MKATFVPVFERLRAIMKPYEGRLVLVHNTPEDYSLNTPYSDKFGKQVFFGAVQIKKNYVSYHLMPIYMNPKLHAGISPT